MLKTAAAQQSGTSETAAGTRVRHNEDCSITNRRGKLHRFDMVKIHVLRVCICVFRVCGTKQRSSPTKCLQQSLRHGGSSQLLKIRQGD